MGAFLRAFHDLLDHAARCGHGGDRRRERCGRRGVSRVARCGHRIHGAEIFEQPAELGLARGEADRVLEALDGGDRREVLLFARNGQDQGKRWVEPHERVHHRRRVVVLAGRRDEHPGDRFRGGCAATLVDGVEERRYLDHVRDLAAGERCEVTHPFAGAHHEHAGAARAGCYALFAHRRPPPPDEPSEVPCSGASCSSQPRSMSSSSAVSLVECVSPSGSEGG